MTPEQYDYIKDKLDTLCEILTGNGKPEEGLVMKVGKNTWHRRIASKLMWLAITALFIGLVTITFVGCATRAEYTKTVEGFKIRCSPMSTCSGKSGDIEIKVDSKFEPLKEVVTLQKIGP